MGLKLAIRTVAKTALGAVADLMEEGTYLSASEGQPNDYDPATGNITESYASYPVKMLFSDFSSDEIETLQARYRDSDPNLFLNTTKKGRIAALDLTPTPKVGDKITFNGISWDVFDVKTDAATAMWTLFIRKP